MPALRKRPFHWLAPNIRSSVPSQMVFVDCETTPSPLPTHPDTTVHRLRLGHAIACRLEAGAVTRRKDLAFTTPEQFWGWLDEILSSRRQTWLFAHSAGFDMTVLGLWQQIEQGWFRLADIEDPEHIKVTPDGEVKKGWTGLLVAEDPPTIISLRRGDRGLVIVDTRNYWPQSLMTLGISVGLPKYGWCPVASGLVEWHHPEDQTNLKRLPPWELPDIIWAEYCKRDTEIIFRAVVNLALWWQDEDLGTFRYTAPGLAWNAYRHRFYREKSVLITDGCDCDLARQAYYGGEVRCFYTGAVLPLENWKMQEWNSPGPDPFQMPFGPVYELDVTSLYPSVMVGNRFPAYYLETLESPSLDKVKELMKDRGLVAECYLATQTDTYPVRIGPKGEPVAIEEDASRPGGLKYKGGQTRYAKGRFTTYLCSPELQRALANGHVLSFGRVQVYGLEELFTEFIHYFWQGRQLALRQGDATRAGFYKLVMNSLSGKWAQRKGTWIDDPESPCISVWGQWLHGFDPEGKPAKFRGVASHVQRYSQGEESADSAPAISAFITSFAREILANLRKIAGQRNVYYQDTDSLHVNLAGYRALQENGWVGENTLGKLRLKDSVPTAIYYGLKHYRLGDRIVCGAIRKGAYEVGSFEYEYSQFHGLDHTLSSKPDNSIREVRVRKRLSACHPDGEPGSDGWTIPLTL